MANIKSSKKEYSWLFLIVNISVSFWAIGDLVMLFSTNKNIAFLGAMIFYIAPIFTPVALMLFSQGFPYGVKNKALYAISFTSVLLASVAIIISSDKPPKEMETLEDRIRSRLEWGVPVDIHSPDYETRMAILRKKAEIDRIDVPDEVLQYISNNIKITSS